MNNKKKTPPVVDFGIFGSVDLNDLDPQKKPKPKK